MKYFGTDGIRDIAWEGLLTDENISRLLCSIINTLHIQSVVVGRDTRDSSSGISYIINREYQYRSIQVYNLGVVSTPMVSFYTTHFGADLGIMITASHNPPEYNGIKLFGSDGYKLDNDILGKIEYNYDHFQDCPILSFVPPIYYNNRDDYISSLPKLTNTNVIVDTANGSLFNIASLIFPTVIGNNPNGNNINETGCMNMDFILSYANGGFGIAFDGDGDRMLFVYGDKVYDGDDYLFIMSKFYDRIVGTILSNSGLGDIPRSDVGDSNLIELVKDADVGCEPNGHCIFNGDKTADALKNAIRLANVFDISLLSDFHRVPQYSLDIPITERKDLSEFDLSGYSSRIVLRYSNTENLLRLMVEGSKEEYDKLVLSLYKFLSQ